MTPIPVKIVGVCAVCGGPVLLQLEAGCRSAVCARGCAVIPEEFFAACGFGDAARVSSRERIMAARTTGNGRLLDVLDELVQEGAVRSPWHDDEGERLVGL